MLVQQLQSSLGVLRSLPEHRSGEKACLVTRGIQDVSNLLQYVSHLCLPSSASPLHNTNLLPTTYSSFTSHNGSGPHSSNPTSRESASSPPTNRPTKPVPPIVVESTGVDIGEYTPSPHHSSVVLTQIRVRFCNSGSVFTYLYRTLFNGLSLTRIDLIVVENGDVSLCECASLPVNLFLITQICIQFLSSWLNRSMLITHIVSCA